MIFLSLLFEVQVEKPLYIKVCVIKVSIYLYFSTICIEQVITCVVVNRQIKLESSGLIEH